MFRWDRITSRASCPRLSRASTSFLRHLNKQDVDGRDKPGHDSEQMVRYDQNARSVGDVMSLRLERYARQRLAAILRGAPQRCRALRTRATNSSHAVRMRSESWNALPASTSLLLRHFDRFLVGRSGHDRVHLVAALVDNATDAVIEFAGLGDRRGLGLDVAR